MCTFCNLQRAAINRHRKKLFGDSYLKVYSTTPADGEAVAGAFQVDWCGQRVVPTTTNAGAEAGAWQYQIWAKDDWETSQTFMLKIVALTVGTRRWKVKKVEKPIGHSLVWKIKAEIQ